MKEEEKIDTLTDPEEIAAREKLLEELEAKEIEYNAHINNYYYALHCKAIEARGLKYNAIPKSDAEKKWEAYFASELTDDVRERIYYNDFKWHIFSYKVVDAKSGADARRAFNRCKKSAAYMFIQCTDEAWYIENADLLTASDFGKDFYSFPRADVYVFDAEGKWAFVRTHESMCGPYFVRNK